MFNMYSLKTVDFRIYNITLTLDIKHKELVKWVRELHKIV